VHLQALYQKLGNHVQAFSLQQTQISNLKAGSTTTIIEGGGGNASVSGEGIPVNNQSGVTSYATVSGDDGALILFADASTIAVSLTAQTPPWSCFISNQGALGAGTVALTPATGMINGGATLAIPPTYWALVCFDSVNFWAATLPVAPASFNAVAHEFLTAYNAATGAFSAAQPAFTDISGAATAAQVPALSAMTGQITTSQLPSAGISATITTAKLTGGGTNGSMTFTNGILTASTPAT
jgi:hypothetical protein